MMRIGGKSTFTVTRADLLAAMQQPDNRDISAITHIHSAEDAKKVFNPALRNRETSPGDVIEISTACYMGQQRYDKIPFRNNDQLRPRLRGEDGLSRLQTVAKYTDLERIILLAYDTRVSSAGYTIDENQKCWRKDFDANIVYATTGCTEADSHTTQISIWGYANVVMLVASFLETAALDINTALDADWEHITLRCYRHFCIDLVSLVKDLTKIATSEHAHVSNIAYSNQSASSIVLKGWGPVESAGEQKTESITVRSAAVPFLAQAMHSVARFQKLAVEDVRLNEQGVADELCKVLKEENFGFRHMLRLALVSAMNLETICTVGELLCVPIYVGETELMESWYTSEGGSIENYKDCNMTRSVALDVLELLEIDISKLCERERGSLFEDEDIGLEIDSYDMNENLLEIEPLHSSYDSRGLRQLDEKITTRWGTIRPYRNGTFLSSSPDKGIHFQNKEGKKLRACCADGEILIYKNSWKARIQRALLQVTSVGIAQVTITLSSELGAGFLCGSAAFNSAISGKYGSAVAFWAMAKCFAGDIMVRDTSPFTCFLPSCCLSVTARTICNTTLSRSLLAKMVFAVRESKKDVELYWLPMTSGRAFKIRASTTLTHMKESERELGESFKLCRWYPRNRACGTKRLADDVVFSRVELEMDRGRRLGLEESSCWRNSSMSEVSNQVTGLHSVDTLMGLEKLAGHLDRDEIALVRTVVSKEQPGDDADATK